MGTVVQMSEPVEIDLHPLVGQGGGITKPYVDDDPRPIYILALLAQALDEVQDLIHPSKGSWVDPPLPSQEQWDRIVRAAFPPPPMA